MGIPVGMGMGWVGYGDRNSVPMATLVNTRTCNSTGGHWRRQLWGTGVHAPPPSTSNNLFCSASLWSYRPTQYDSNLLCEISSIFAHPPQLLKLVHFSFYRKRIKRQYRVFLYHGIYLSPILCYYMCVTSVTSLSFCAPPRAKSCQRHCWWELTKVKYTDIAVRSLTHMPYRTTQCYLPPDRGDIPAFTPAARAGTPAKAGTRS